MRVVKFATSTRLAKFAKIKTPRNICRIQYHKFGQNIEFFKNLCTKYMANSEAMTSSTHSFAYSYRLVKKCFVKICETSKCHNFLIFQPIFIRFSLFCSENFTLSSEIMLNLFRSSPLNNVVTKLKWDELVLQISFKTNYYTLCMDGQYKHPYIQYHVF